VSQVCLEATKAKRLSHPRYIPDPAITDFFLFGYIKGKLADYQWNTRDELKVAIAEILNGIRRERLRSVFVEWIKRLKWVIKNKGSTTTRNQKIKETTPVFIEKRTDRELSHRLMESLKRKASVTQNLSGGEE
jgi:nuclear transport factor 2 (NTF2) superfamily protein